MSLRKMFIEANTQSIKYIVLNDNDSLPETIHSDENEVRILVDQQDRARLLKVFQLIPTVPKLRDRCEIYNSEDQTIPDDAKFRIITKGRGYFPETFETRLLTTRHIKNSCVPSPDFSELVWIILYECHKHGYPLDTNRCKKIIKSRLESHVGNATYRNPHASKLLLKKESSLT